MVPSPLPYLYRSTLSRYLKNEAGQQSWALVTGASDGIGQGFAQELCAKGFNVILHGRNEEKLKRVQGELQESFPSASTRIVIADAVSFTPEAIDSIYSAVQDLTLKVLINNVGGTGVLHANFQTFEDYTPKEISDLISVNVTFTLKLTERLMPILRAQKPSLLMNVGSLAHAGTPFLSVYSGTKAFLHAWTRCLKLELDDAGAGIEVLEVLVGSVQSQQNQTDAATFFVPSSRVMARSALARVGCGSASVIGYFPHALQWFGFGLLPTSIVDSIIIRILKPVAGSTERRW